MHYISEKFSAFDLYRKLTEMHWKGKYYSLSDETTFLSESNEVLAVVTYCNRRSLILSVEFK